MSVVVKGLFYAVLRTKWQGRVGSLGCVDFFLAALSSFARQFAACERSEATVRRHSISRMMSMRIGAQMACGRTKRSRTWAFDYLGFLPRVVVQRRRTPRINQMLSRIAGIQEWDEVQRREPFFPGRIGLRDEEGGLVCCMSLLGSALALSAATRSAKYTLRSD